MTQPTEIIPPLYVIEGTVTLQRRGAEQLLRTPLGGYDGIPFCVRSWPASPREGGEHAVRSAYVVLHDRGDGTAEVKKDRTGRVSVGFVVTLAGLEVKA